MRSFSESYRDAGVNIEAGYEGVKLMKKHVQRTMIPGVVSDIGGFGGLFAPDLTGMSEPVLVSGTDGVGTKQRIAQLMNKHDSVGIDCVAMCVNDIICCGAKPIFFLDYIAIGKNIPEKVVSLVSGVSEGCVRAGCALIGGETAEHPGTMKPGASWTVAKFWTRTKCSREMWSSRCPPAGCTPTATRSCARCSMWRTPTSGSITVSWAC